ncbi:cell division protein FtsB [Cognatilysobacter bugurensis]|uniref:Cell division protein FtsB n=1 Tax=Cognatilysobacter bugurensis TaxID=543356 RepID=A0A918SS93_9GAMM|nr:cell division protein FtsB [Lysobacter bugurensis]GHA68900.1 cell division protein FtsB [Lysobacter bugurensis]
MVHTSGDRRLLVALLALAALLALLQARLWLGTGGYQAVAALEQQVQAQTRENAGLGERNDALAAEVEDLKSGEAAAEERARSELGMIKPGEVFYRVVESDGAPVRETRVPDASADVRP